MSKGNIIRLVTVGLLGLLLATVPLSGACAKPAPTPTPAPAPAPKPTPAPTPPPAPKPTPAPTPTPKPTPAPAPAVKMPRTLTVIGGATPGSTTDLIKKWIALQIRSAFSEITVREMPGGTYDAPHKVDVKEGDIGVSAPDGLLAALQGQEPQFTYPHRNLRQMFDWCSPGSGLQVVVLRNSNITELSQIKNRRIGVGLTTSATGPAVEKTLKKTYGFNYKDVQAAGGLVHWGDWAGQIDMLGEGKLDVVFFHGPHPSSYISTLNMTRGIRLVPMGAAFLDNYVVENIGYGHYTLPAGKYDGQTEPYNTVAIHVSVVCHQDADTDVVYKLCEAIFKDGGRAVADINAVWKGWLPFDNAAENSWIEWHPGAAKFFQSKGVTLKPVRIK